MFKHSHQLRVRYSESDRMGTFYNSRLLEWMEVGRSELLRAAGKTYAQWEAEGVMAPIIESGLKFRGRAAYDDLLTLQTVCEREGRARLKFSTVVVQAETDRPVAEGWTVHALTNSAGTPVRIPDWFENLLNGDIEQ